MEEGLLIRLLADDTVIAKTHEELQENGEHTG
jgi:hypothetical protein